MKENVIGEFVIYNGIFYIVKDVNGDEIVISDKNGDEIVVNIEDVDFQ